MVAMIVELQHFIEFKSEWYGDGPDAKTRARMVFEPVTLNLEYASSIKRYLIHGGIQFCIIHMQDYGNSFVVDKTYEEMRDLLKARRK